MARDAWRALLAREEEVRQTSDYRDEKDLELTIIIATKALIEAQVRTRF